MLAATVLLVSAPAWSVDMDPAFGRWVVDDGRAVVEIARCAEKVCGWLVWLREPFGANGEPKRDVNNLDRSKRMRPICRLRLIRDLTRVEPGVWEGGEIYSTRDGKRYGFDIEGVEGDRMTVRGYYGIPFLGRTQVWTRDNSMRRACTPFDRPGTNR